MQVNDLRHFDYSGRGTLREMFLIIGNVIKSTIQEKLRNCESIGVFIDEVTDISVFSQLITFIEFVDPNSGKLLVNLLSVDNVLEGFNSANARAISELVLKSFVDSDVPFSRVTGFSSNGASVMLGKNNGVAARLRDHNPKLINIHCVCHKLALACSHSHSEIQCIKQIQETLFGLWKYLENSPKRMVICFKVQENFHSINIRLTAKCRRKLTKRFKKAVKSRWPSFDQAVSSMIDKFQVVFRTLRELDETEHCPIAHGYLVLLTEFMFLSMLYVLCDVLPILACLSKTFQEGKFNFSQKNHQLDTAKQNWIHLLKTVPQLLNLKIKLRKRSMQRSLKTFKSLLMVRCRRHANSCQSMWTLS